MIATVQRYTLADLPNLPDDDYIYDILGGKLSVHNAPDDNHAELLTELFDFLIAAQHAGYGRVYTSSRAVALDYPARGMAAEDVTQPDLFFVRPGREHLRGRRAFQGVLDLVIEILSPSTREEHAPGGDLWQAYERNGLPQYWVVDPAHRTISQYVLRGESYVGGHYSEPLIVRGADLLTCSLFPDLSIEVARVFRGVVDYDR
jgi:Uma2 family endonuclease